jgi:hypothetical protein
MLMRNDDHPECPSISIHRHKPYGQKRVRTFIAIATRHHYMDVPAPWWATLVVWWCRLFHRARVYSMPAAGRNLTWDITCHCCGCHYQIVRRNSPRWVTPWKYDRSRPRTWREWEAKDLERRRAAGYAK